MQIDINKPGSVDWKNLKYNFNIENYGRSTADSVDVNLDLNYFKGQTGSIEKLPTGELYTFTFDAVPPMADNLQNPFLDNVKQIISEEKVGAGTIIINYKWLGLLQFQREYTVVIKNDGVLVYYKN